MNSGRVYALFALLPRRTLMVQIRPYILQLLFCNRVQVQPDCDTIPESRVNATTSSNWLLIRELHISGRSYINYRNTCIIIPGELQRADYLHAMTA
jgi:hypothetical protein